MRLLPNSAHFVLLFFTLSVVWAASSWSFDDATLSIHNKKAGVGGARQDKYGASDQPVNFVKNVKFSFLGFTPISNCQNLSNLGRQIL